MENLEIKKVVIYCRVSSRKQVIEGNGLDSQEQICRGWAKQRGYIVERVFREEGVSGAEQSRPALDIMLNFLDGSKERFIALFYDISRVARETTLFLNIAKKIQSKGHCLATSQGLIEDTPIGKFLATIQAGYSTLFREENAIRTKNNMEEHLRQGFWVMRAPTGYCEKRINGKIHIVRIEPSATYLQEALEGFAGGRFNTQKEVFDFLKDKRIIGLGGRPVKITHNFVGNLLKNEKYTGWFAYKKKNKNVEWGIPYQKWSIEPIISIDIYKTIQDRLKGRKGVRPRKYNWKDEDFPLRRAVRCSCCGGTLTAGRTKSHTGALHYYYQCHSKGCPNYGKSIRRADIHGDLENILKIISPDVDITALATRIIHDTYKELTADAKNNIACKNAEIASKRAEKDKTFELLVKSSESPEIEAMCKERISKLTEEINILMAGIEVADAGTIGIEEATAYVMDFMSRPLEIWQNGDYYDKVGVLNLCFDGDILYDKDEKFRTVNLAQIYGVFEESLGNLNEWRAQKDSNPQSSDP